MKATEVIKRDHEGAKELFERFKAASDEDKRTAEKDLFKALNTHELMEDTHFYPVLKERAGDNEMLKELEHEQDTLKLEVMAAQGMELVTGAHDERMEKVMEKVLEHAMKEETHIFPLAEEVLGPELLEELGEKMEPESATANA